MHGALITILAFWAVAFATTQGQGTLPFFVGSHHMRSGPYSVSRSSLESPVTYSEVTVKPNPEDPWRDFATTYYNIIYVLGALDTNRDYVISSSEIAHAPAALRKLDLDGDGKLSAEECGFYIGFRKQSERREARPPVMWPPEFLQHLRVGFMHANPVLNVLDADQDQTLSAEELKNSPAALKRLDLNGDGRLLPVELAPDSVAQRMLR